MTHEWEDKEHTEIGCDVQWQHRRLRERLSGSAVGVTPYLPLCAGIRRALQLLGV